MISRYEAYMDGTPLSQVNPNLLIHDIQHSISDTSFSTGIIANQRGSIITGESQRGSSVTILFELHLYSIRERQAACQEVVKWASGRILETNDRQGQRLYVRCTQYPRIDSAKNWTDVISMEFTAFEKPFWEEKSPVTLTLSGTEEDGELYVPGNAWDAFPDITITPDSTLADITITCGDTSITLTGCGATTANPVIIARDTNGFLSIKTGSTSLLNKRTGSDELLLKCGDKNTISYTASESVTVDVSVRGLWM